MKTRVTILALFCFLTISIPGNTSGNIQIIRFDFFGKNVELPFDNSCLVSFESPLNQGSIGSFYAAISKGDYSPLIEKLHEYRVEFGLDDWLFYQLIRRTAQQVSPKEKNYFRYTLYKWFFLTRSGYDATLKFSDSKLLFYIQTNDSIYNLPCYFKDAKQYVCLNYHDYGGNIDFIAERFTEATGYDDKLLTGFTYKVTRLPGFESNDYQEKALHFNYNENEYSFRIKLNPHIKTIFANYPVVDYETYFNIPLSEETYLSLIPHLKKQLKGKNTKSGVEYLMHFTRYAFLFQPDAVLYGNEKRLSPEQTLGYDQSDCEDRAALFFYLVKELYNLPMIVLTYPEHVTIAIKLNKPSGASIVYKGERYSVCEPTPQREELALGQLSASLKNERYKVVYEYTPRQ